MSIPFFLKARHINLACIIYPFSRRIQHDGPRLAGKTACGTGAPARYRAVDQVETEEVAVSGLVGCVPYSLAEPAQERDPEMTGQLEVQTECVGRVAVAHALERLPSVGGIGAVAE